MRIGTRCETKYLSDYPKKELLRTISDTFYLCIYLFIYFIYLFMYLCMYVFIYLFIHLCIYLFMYLLIYLFISKIVYYNTQLIHFRVVNDLITFLLTK